MRLKIFLKEVVKNQERDEDVERVEGNIQKKGEKEDGKESVRNLVERDKRVEKDVNKSNYII